MERWKINGLLGGEGGVVEAAEFFKLIEGHADSKLFFELSELDAGGYGGGEDEGFYTSVLKGGKGLTCWLMMVEEWKWASSPCFP